MSGWIAENWFDLLSAVGIIGSLLLTAVSLQSGTKTRRVGNLLTLTQNHREIWSELFDHRELRRVLSPDPDLSKTPMSLDERWFANLVIQHLSSAYEALKSGLAIKPEGLANDVGWFFSLPIPRAVWEGIEPLQNPDFVDFVRGCLHAKS